MQGNEITVTHTDSLIQELDDKMIDQVSGGFVCGGLCVLAAIGAAAGIASAGVAIGAALHDAFHAH